MNKFSFIDQKTTKRWDFEILASDLVRIGYPELKVVYDAPIDFDPKVEFEGDQDRWIEWGAEELLSSGLVVFDEWHGLQTEETMAEIEQEARWEREHIRQESDPRNFH